MTDRSNSSAIPPRPESLNPQHITDMAHAIAPVPLRARIDGWSPEKQVAFIEALAACGCVAEAAARVGMSARSAYTLRARPGARSFREAWDVAQDSAVERLSDAMFGRALHGVARPVFYQGEQIGEKRYYDERLAMFILSRRAPDRFGEWIDRREVRRDHDETGAALGEALARVEEDALLEAGGGPPQRGAGGGRGGADGLRAEDGFDEDALHALGLDGLGVDGLGLDGLEPEDDAPPERPPLPRPVYFTERHAEEHHRMVERMPTSEETDELIMRKLAVLRDNPELYAHDEDEEEHEDEEGYGEYDEEDYGEDGDEDEEDDADRGDGPGGYGAQDGYRAGGESEGDSDVEEGEGEAPWCFDDSGGGPWPERGDGAGAYRDSRELPAGAQPTASNEGPRSSGDCPNAPPGLASKNHSASG